MRVQSLSHIALVGVPNSGKTTLFNAVTGMKKKVANYPGVTVEPTIGIIRGCGKTVALVDLPGIYSLTAQSPDEEIAASALHGQLPGVPDFEGVVLVLDATNLERGLYLFTHLSQLGKPMLVALTMIDELKGRGGILDDISLETILGVRVVPIVGIKGVGVADLVGELFDHHQWRLPREPIAPSSTPEARIAWARSVIKQVVHKDHRDELSERIDQIVLHPIWGMALFVFVMAAIFQSIFTWAQPLMEGIDQGVAHLRRWITGDAFLPSLWTDFLANGLVAGVGTVLVFAPQIFILMVLVTLLEDSGYMARAAFLVDRIMGIFGLQGRAFIPLLSSYACAIPGILAARVIPSRAERMATILVAPLMTCSARLPVYTLLIGAFVPQGLLCGIISTQAAVLGGLYIAAALIGLIIAWLLRKSLFIDTRTTFFIEFPPYRLPHWRNVLQRALMRMQDFFQTAGTVIVVISVVLWSLSSFPRIDAPLSTPKEQIRRIQLEQSFAAKLGQSIAPIFSPMHFDWQVTLGIIGSFTAREVFVSVMGQLYTTTNSDPSNGALRNALQRRLQPAVAYAVIAFYMFALQCMSTVATLRRETGSWRWAAFAFVYMFILAYGAAVITYNIAKLVLS